MVKRSKRYRFIRYKDEIYDRTTILLRAIIYDEFPPYDPNRNTTFEVVWSKTKKVPMGEATEREKKLPSTTHSYFLSTEQYFYLRQLIAQDDDAPFYYDPEDHN